MYTQEDVEQEHTAKNVSLMQATMKSNARKSVKSEAESAFSIGSKASSSKHPSKSPAGANINVNDSFNTPMVSSPTF